MFTLGRWLLAGKKDGEMATLQPVSKLPGEFWTDDFRTAAQWFRAEDGGRRMKVASKAPAKKAAHQKA